MGIPEKKNQPIVSVNQEIYKQLRNRHNNNMKDYYVRVEKGEAKQLFWFFYFLFFYFKIFFGLFNLYVTILKILKIWNIWNNRNRTINHRIYIRYIICKIYN